MATPGIVFGAHTKDQTHPPEPHFPAHRNQAWHRALILSGKVQDCRSSLQSRQHPQLCRGQAEAFPAGKDKTAPGHGMFSPGEGLECCPQPAGQDPQGQVCSKPGALFGFASCHESWILECKVSDTAPTRNIPFRKFDVLKFQGYNEVSMSSVALCAAALHPTVENTW